MEITLEKIEYAKNRYVAEMEDVMNDHRVLCERTLDGQFTIWGEFKENDIKRDVLNDIRRSISEIEKFYIPDENGESIIDKIIKSDVHKAYNIATDAGSAASAEYWAAEDCGRYDQEAYEKYSKTYTILKAKADVLWDKYVECFEKLTDEEKNNYHMFKFLNNISCPFYINGLNNLDRYKEMKVPFNWGMKEAAEKAVSLNIRRACWYIFQWDLYRRCHNKEVKK